MDLQTVQNHVDSGELYNKKVNLSSHEQYKNLVNSLLRKKIRKNNIRKWLEENIKKILPVFSLDFAPIWGLLSALYSNDKRGKPPYDPQILLRSFLLMISFHETSITQWVSELSCNEELLIFCGIKGSRTPGVATHYDFLQRLENGAYQPKCQHYVPESVRRKNASHVRPAKHKPDKEEAESERVPDDHVIEKLVKDTVSRESEPRIKNLQTLLNTLLFKLAIHPSYEKGFLTDLQKMTFFGDGSVIPSHCNYNGKPTCDCRQRGIYICDHDRILSDLLAEWGWDNRSKCLIFGYRFFQLVSGDNKHDLPVYLNIAPANKHEALMAVNAIDDLDKILHESSDQFSLHRASFDALFDANDFYKYLIHKGINYAIPYRTKPAACLELGIDRDKFSPEGSPLCSGGLPMRYHFKDRQGRHVYACPVKRLARRDGKKVYICYSQECPLGQICQPQSTVGPLVHVSSDIDYRIHPPIVRGSEEYKELRNLRTTCERSNSIKKYTYLMSHVRTRVMSYAFIRLFLISILEHTKVWVQDVLKMPRSNVMELLA